MLLTIVVSLATLPQTVSSTCFVSTTSSVRRDVISTVSQMTLPGCKILCMADANCQATLLNAAGDACVLLGVEIPDTASNSCPAPFASYVKTETGCVDLPQTPIAAGYTPGECSTMSDVVGDLATDGSAPVCGSQPADQRRVVVDAIQHDGTRVVLENYYVAVAVWDGSVGSWYLDLVETPNNERYYFQAAKCVSAPVEPLTPNCACTPLPTEPADPGNSNPTTPLIDVDPPCSTGWIQMVYTRVAGMKTYDSALKKITCMMGTWMMVRTSTDYNEYALNAATCVE